ncbi:MAG: hypothetical protein HC854_11675 [Flavobacterium sp.]|nr:hypothetical protein [Flavobacterium sp.]
MPDAQNITNDIGIFGWKFSNENPSVTASIRINNFIENRVSIVDRLVEEKDKDGKVIKSYKLYKAITSFDGNARIDVSTTFSITEEKEVDKKVTENRFLSSAATTKNTKTGASSFYANQNFSINSKEYNSSYEAEKDYKLNRANTYNTQLKNYVSHVVSTVNNHLNYKFGFKPNNERFILWIIDSKEEEGQIQKDAIEAVKIIFSEMKANLPINSIEEKLQPLIAYFESLKTKYPNDDKGSKKIRYSAYFNLGKIYYYLDQPEKAIKEGQGLIDNDYDKKDGEEIIKDSEKLIELFKSKNFTTRHNVSLN